MDPIDVLVIVAKKYAVEKFVDEDESWGPDFIVWKRPHLWVKGRLQIVCKTIRVEAQSQ